MWIYKYLAEYMGENVFFLYRYFGILVFAASFDAIQAGKIHCILRLLQIAKLHRLSVYYRGDQ